MPDQPLPSQERRGTRRYREPRVQERVSLGIGARRGRFRTVLLQPSPGAHHHCSSGHGQRSPSASRGSCTCARQPDASGFSRGGDGIRRRVLWVRTRPVPVRQVRPGPLSAGRPWSGHGREGPGSLPRRPDLHGDRADVIGVGRHLVDGVRVRAALSLLSERVDVREAARGRLPAVGRRDVPATAPKRSGYTTMA